MTLASKNKDYSIKKRLIGAFLVFVLAKDQIIDHIGVLLDLLLEKHLSRIAFLNDGQA